MPIYKQQNRPLQIQTPLGEDVLLIASLRGEERLGRPFQYELVLKSEEENLDYNAILGQNVTILLDAGVKEPRFFNGYVSRFAQVKYDARSVEYHATIVPWLWLLTRSSDCRIFQNMAIPDIVEQVFKDHGFSDVIERLADTYQPRDYCVQYRETAYDFVSRLMEEEGIYYFFKHENGKHSLVMCDSPASHKEYTDHEELLFLPTATAPVESLETWEARVEVQSGLYATTDFDFTTPRKDTQANSHRNRGHGHSALEQFDYLGERNPFSAGERYSRLRLEEHQAQHEIYTGEGDDRRICTGTRFVLKGHPRKDFEKQYLTTGVDYLIECDPYKAADTQDEAFKFKAKLTATLLEEQFRPPRLTAKSVAHGPQTAMVVGPPGQKIYTDNYGRVKVQFHWDRRGKKDENSSCWMRVSQSWASQHWGDMAIPHVGDEVIVECLGGDPDQPIITGRVFNEAAMPPFHLPANKHKRIWQDDYGNRLVFDATPGDEHVRLFSPHHKSGLTLGRSSIIFNEMNTYVASMGEVLTCAIGGTLQSFVGGFCQAVVGTYIQPVVGANFTTNIGSVTNVNLGPQVTYQKGVKYQQNDDDFLQVCDGNVVISAKQTANLVGGAGGANTANLYANDNGMELTAGPTLTVNDTAYTTTVKALDIMTILFPVLAAGFAAGASAYVSNSNPSMPPSPEDPAVQNGLTTAQTIFETAAIVFEAAALVLMFVNIGILSGNTVATQLVRHQLPAAEPKSVLRLGTDGNVLLSADESLYLSGGDAWDGALLLNAQKAELSHQTQISILTGPAASTSGIVLNQAGTVNIAATTKVSIEAATFDVGNGALTVMSGVPGPSQVIASLTTQVAALQAKEAALEADYLKQMAAQKAKLVALATAMAALTPP